MQELTDEQMNEVSGGSWGKQQQLDLRLFNKTGYYFYPVASVTVKGGRITLKPGASREKISSNWGVKKVKVGTASYTFKDSKGKTHSMIHVDFSGKKGYINANFKRYLISNSGSKKSSRGGDDDLSNWDLVN